MNRKGGPLPSIKSLIASALQSDSDQAWAAIHALRAQGGDLVEGVCDQLFRAKNPRKRELAALIAAQLSVVSMGARGRRKYTPWAAAWAEERLVACLADHDRRVRSAGVSGLGHRPCAAALPKLLRFVDDADEDCRFSLALALGSYDQEDSASGLMRLMQDRQRDVRNWATFSLGSLLSIDAPAIRDALLQRACELDAEIRGEALVGLAKRHDARVDDLVLRELTGPFHGTWVLEAAALRGSPAFVAALEQLRNREGGELISYQVRQVDEAIEACRASSAKPPVCDPESKPQQSDRHDRTHPQ